MRIALARALTEADKFIAKKGLVEEGAPVIVRLIAIALRFGVFISEKVAAQALLLWVRLAVPVSIYFS